MNTVERMRAIPRRERGFVLPIVLVLFAVGMLLVAPTLSHGYVGLKDSGVTQEKANELEAADSGVEDALYWMLHEETFADRYAETAPGTWELQQPYQMNGATVTVSVQEAGGNLLVVSTATNGSSSTTATALVERQTSSGGNPSPFENAVTSLDGDVVISGGSSIFSDPEEDQAANVFSGGELVVQPSASIEGDVYAEEGITTGWSTTISGDAYTPGGISQPPHQDFIGGNEYPGAPEQDPPTLSDDEVAAIVDGAVDETDFSAFSGGPVTIGGDWSLTYYPAPATYYGSNEHVGGSLIVKTGTSVTFGGRIYIDGDLQVSSSGKTFIFDQPVVVNGNVSLQNGNVIFRDSVWVADGSNLTLSGSATATFDGPVRVGGNLNLGSGGDVSFGSTIYVGGPLSGSGARTLSISGTVYVGGDLSLSGSAVMEGGQTIVVEGDTTVPGATRIEEADQLPFILCPTGGFAVSGSGYASAAVYAPEADVTLSGSAGLYGAIICGSISITGSSSVEYPVDLADRDDLPGGGGTTGTTGVSVISYEVS